MDNTDTTWSTSPPMYLKTSSNSAAPWSSVAGGVVKNIQAQQPFRAQSFSREELKERVYDKSKVSQKHPTKEQTKPLEIKLHTQQRAVRRAGFNDLVAIKLNFTEAQRKFEEKVKKIIEEEEIRMLRKELIPKAQLMPLFDRPFFPQRSNRPLTVPREPSSRILSSTYCSELYGFQQSQNRAMKPIK
ncbi:hypothetical protein HHK36_014731 [Tetracentron sinense]|uniref:TPX2 C-terminal domain-containing protein n=1 Tax=Tetracentron sinense TaxID=13715 RepID=A0A835DFI1_TETSI|nr:hypothetical protein HHK36_014731 [Tetracentron sinense]